LITYTGRPVWPTWIAERPTPEGEPDDIGPSIEDIAVGLGRQSRFAGQTREFYTVLCHSLVTGQVAREFWPDDQMLRRHLLLHDGHESMIGDVPTTWKGVFTRIDEAELDRRIAAEHGLEPLSDENMALLKSVDFAALRAEAHALGHAEAERWWPKDDFDGLAARAFDLTVQHLQAGNPVRYLNPQAAIQALTRALAS
jgi:5'-deoxynucleotidase YfbR-like HD superfamily hydrolase